MSATRRSPANEAAAARVRAAIAAAGEERMERLARVKQSHADLLRARAQGRTLRALAAEAGVTAQCLQYRERMALRALKGDSPGGER